jgi:hypothetical protein
MSATPSTAVPGYGLAPPTADDALAYLARAVGPDRAAGVWLRACAAVGAPRGGLSVDEMMRVSEHLSREAGVVGVIGNSLLVRVRTYRLLASVEGRR